MGSEPRPGEPTRLDGAGTSPTSPLRAATPGRWGEPGREQRRLGPRARPSSRHGCWRAVALSRGWVWAADWKGGRWRRPKLTGRAQGAGAPCRPGPRQGPDQGWWERILCSTGGALSRTPPTAESVKGRWPGSWEQRHRDRKAEKLPRWLRALQRSCGAAACVAAQNTPSPSAPAHPHLGAALPGQHSLLRSGRGRAAPRAGSSQRGRAECGRGPADLTDTHRQASFSRGAASPLWGSQGRREPWPGDEVGPSSGCSWPLVGGRCTCHRK